MCLDGSLEFDCPILHDGLRGTKIWRASLSVRAGGLDALSPVDNGKRAAARQAVDQCVMASDRVIGIGSGSTIAFAVDRLRERVASEKLDIVCVPTSFQATDLIIQAGLRLGDLYEFPEVDVAIDGADEIDLHRRALIKGGGGALLREKIIAYAAKSFVVIADDSKLSGILGTKWRKGVPVEVLPMAVPMVVKRIQKNIPAGKPTVRQAMRKAGPVITDNGNMIIDVDFGEIEDPVILERSLLSIPGVIECGIFNDMFSDAFVGSGDGEVRRLK